MTKFGSLTASRRQLLTGAAATVSASFADAFFPGFALAKAPMIGTQAPAYYRFKLGDFEGTVVSDGPIMLGEPQDNIFIGVSKDEFTRVQNENFLPTTNIGLDQNALVINTGDRIVLFDTGLGSAKLFGPSVGRLIANLKAADIEPKDVDAIVLTHAHGDHCWGIMADDGTRNFPNAQIYIAQNELKFWTDESRAADDMFKMMLEGARKHLLPNRDRIVFVKDGQEILPGIRAMAAPGHTVGHTIYLITSQGKTICNGGDIAHHHVLVVERPRLAFAYDTDGNQAADSRVRVFDMLASERIPLIAYHFPWPGMGYIAKRGDGFRYHASLMQMVL